MFNGSLEKNAKDFKDHIVLFNEMKHAIGS